MSPIAPIIFFGSGAIFLALSFYSFRRPHVPGSKIFGWVMLTCAWWVFCYAMDLISATPEGRFVWVKLKYLGNIPASFLWLPLVLELTGKKFWFGAWWYRGLWFLATGFILVIFTNDYHELFWEFVEVKAGETHSGRAKGAAFYLYALCATFIALTSIALILLHSIKAVGFYRRRNFWLLLGFVSPYLGFWLDIKQLLPFFADIDSVLLMLVPSATFMAIAMFRYQAMDIVPLAQKMVFENVRSAVVVIDPAREVVATNAYAKTVFGEGDEAEHDVRHTISELAREGLEHGAEIEYQMHKRWYLVIVSELANEREGHLGHSFVFVDITDRKQEEIERTEIVDARAKFFASVSHELRSPLHAIRGLLDMTLRSGLDDKQHRHLEDAKASSNMLLSLIDNVLDESRLQADMMPLEVVPTDLLEVADQLRAVHTYSARKKGLELNFNVDDLATAVLSDPLRLTQVLGNLVSNAIKFSNTGRIDVDIAVLRDVGTQIEIAFSVTDTGIGISEEDLSVLFEPFQQGELSTARKFGGTGLGLAISQALTARMGGEITVQSELQSGSTFGFVLEFEKTSLGAIGPADPIFMPDLSAYEILVVDDSDINLEIISAQLEPMGIQFDPVIDGALAITCATQKRYDLVLLDVHMPLMSGLDVVGRIKALPKYTEVPIIAMSASVLREDRQLASDAGFDGFLDKPFTRVDLTNVLQKFLLSVPDAIAEPVVAPKKIVDSVKGIASMNGNKDRYLELLTALADESEDQLETLKECGDKNIRHQILHQLIGAAKLLRADSLANIATEIDLLVLDQVPNSEVLQRLSEIQAQTDSLREWINAQLVT